MKGQPKKNRLEITVLRWDYGKRDDQDGMWDRLRYNNHPHKDEPDYYLPLPEHECRYPRECGLFLDAVEISLGNDGHGKCELLHKKAVRSHTPHEFDLMKKELPPLFKEGERLSIGGGGVTIIYLKPRSTEHFTDAGMRIFKKLLPFFGITDPEEIRRVKGPEIFRRNYIWSIELDGWIAFEDRIAMKHGLRARHAATSGWAQKPINTLWWP